MRMVDLGGRRLALTCSGEGTPTVVLETGLGAESSEWGAVQRDIAQITRVCRYDRARRGASDIAPSPRTALDMVGDLHTLLRVAGIAGPFVLVGHSFGGMLMRLFAHHFADEVSGVVLVDAMHQDQFDIFGPLFPPPAPPEPMELQKTRAFWQEGWRSPNSTTERIDFASSIRQAREIQSLGNAPLHIIIAGTFLNNPVVPLAYRAALQERWQALQMQFLKLSPRACYSLALSSGHFVQRDDPAMVSQAIKAIVTAGLGCKAMALRTDAKRGT
jgi:pimeloyl-ACP methyl ester carboxylesterase